MLSLNQLKFLRKILVKTKYLYYAKIWGMDLHPTCEFSLSAKFDRIYPKGVHIGAYTYVAFDAAILCHDTTRGLYLDTFIGKNCFIGARSIILPGLRISDGCIVGAGSVVTKDVPAKCAVAGNPARIIKENIEVGQYGRLVIADENERRLWLGKNMSRDIR
jgi:acetyltransferase-like isoleucine patch superfamily enzyme